MFCFSEMICNVKKDENKTERTRKGTSNNVLDFQICFQFKFKIMAVKYNLQI